ncbi:hypothetical protein VTJ04DRAFT_151 [Mycothermus thermophilus]|uniref:uncharacterized protein n=1 Tax=Humicola insolens TaxID=85995 RepID=UPI003743F041
MRISGLYVYPIKALRGIELESAHVGPQGIRHDRRFMMYEVQAATGELRKVQVDSHPRCALFDQEFLYDDKGEEMAVAVRFLGNEQEAGDGEDDNVLHVPLNPDIATLTKIDVDLHGSPTTAYRMGNFYDTWISSRLGTQVIFIYIGDGRRAVLGQTLPPKPAQAQSRGRGWLSSLASYVMGSPNTDEADPPKPWITFSDVAPLLITSEASLRDVQVRLLGGLPVDMYKFRPNVVVDGEEEGPWAEDFWAELSISPSSTTASSFVEGASSSHSSETIGTRENNRAANILHLTGNCVRCVSINVDYNTGKPGEGEMGSVLKRLMKDRRVDKGSKWSPVFGRYAFLDGRSSAGFRVSVGDVVQVTRRNAERSVWDWPGL